MNDQEQDRSADEDPKSDEEESAAAYESPAVARLGSVDQLTAQNGWGNGQTQ